MLADEERAIDQDDWWEPWLRPGLCPAAPLRGLLTADVRYVGTVPCSPPEYFRLTGEPGGVIVFIPEEDPRVQQLRDACDA